MGRGSYDTTGLPKPKPKPDDPTPGPIPGPLKAQKTTSSGSGSRPESAHGLHGSHAADKSGQERPAQSGSSSRASGIYNNQQS